MNLLLLRCSKPRMFMSREPIVKIETSKFSTEKGVPVHDTIRGYTSEKATRKSRRQITVENYSFHKTAAQRRTVRSLGKKLKSKSVEQNNEIRRTDLLRPVYTYAHANAVEPRRAHGTFVRKQLRRKSSFFGSVAFNCTCVILL